VLDSLQRRAAFHALVGLIPPSTGITDDGWRFGEGLAAFNTLRGLIAPAARVAELCRYAGHGLATLHTLGRRIAETAGFAQKPLGSHVVIVPGAEANPSEPSGNARQEP